MNTPRSIAVVVGASALLIASVCATGGEATAPASDLFAGSAGQGGSGLVDLTHHGLLTPPTSITLPHTDVPDLPRAGTGGLPGLGSAGAEGVGYTASDPRAKPVPPPLLDAADVLRGVMRLDGGGLINGGSRTADPVRVHTDVPDLPGMSNPLLSETPPRKPGTFWDNLGDQRQPHEGRPESLSIPAPASIVAFGLGMGALLRRRRSSPAR